MSCKDEFIRIYKENIKREGAAKLLEYLGSSASDFFTAPASTRFHGSYEGGLCEHSVNVYNCLSEYLKRERVKKVYGLGFTEETIAIVALLHDVCKTGCYKKDVRNVKQNGVWVQVPAYTYEEEFPYGHGEKSVYIISGFMRLSREEAIAIRYHMGFSATDEVRNVASAFEKYPLSFALSVADMEATYFLESAGK
jgi:hypothetical protein